MTYLEQYKAAIDKGEIVVGYWIRQEVQNLVDEMSDPRFIYDTEHAHKRIRFMETLCLQGKEPFYMKPLKLLLWQKAFIEALYSFKVADTGRRRFTEALLEVARKNGKSTLLAGDGFTDLFIGKGGLDICCASNDDRQARLIWEEMAGMRQRLDPTNAISGANLVKLRNKAKNTQVFRLSSKTQNKDGFNISKTYLDESHDIDEENGQSDVAEACWRGMSSRLEPLFINSTTQGFSRDGCYLDKKIEYAKEVINGERDDIHIIAFLYEQDNEMEVWQDELSWYKSNPSLHVVKQIDKLRRDVEIAKTDKAARIHLLCKDFNIKQNSAEAWLRAEDYSYQTERKTLEDFRGCVCLAALDCSQTTDLTNLKLLFQRPGSDQKYIFSHYWIPESKLQSSADKAAGARYEEWARQGYMTITKGHIIDLTDVTNYIRELKTRYGITVYKCGYDKAYAREFEQSIDRLSESIREPINQKHLSVPMKWTEAEFVAHKINYNNNPVDAWCLSNACCVIDRHGDYSCRKTNPSKRIDGAIVFIILYATLARFRTEFEQRIK